MSRRRKITRGFIYLFLTVVSVISMFPFVWMISASTNKSVDITRGKLLPGTYFLENVKSVLESNLDYFGAFKNSLIIAVLTTVLAMLVSSAAGYAFEIYKSKGKERVFTFVLVSMMIPFSAMMVPLFRLFSKFGSIPLLKGFALNSYGSVIIVSVATAFLIFFFRQNTKTFPTALIEAARMDGLGEWKIFFQIYMPTMKSTYVAAMIVTFMSSWNNYMWPLIALQSENKRTLPLIISAMGSSYTPDYGMMMTAILISIIPTALVFFTMQKYFVAGMTGAVKG